MEMEGVCFRRVVTGLRIGGRKRNADVRKGILITDINAKIEILKRILPRILEKLAKAESQIWSAEYNGGYKITEIPDRQTEGRISLTCIERKIKSPLNCQSAALQAERSRVCYRLVSLESLLT
jgi:hypothetical protein